MKYLITLKSAAAMLLLVNTVSILAQPGPGGRGGRGPQLPPEQQAEVDRINSALEAEAKAVTAANSNLVMAAFSMPLDKEKMSKANDELAKARAAWAAKASKLFAETQASDKKLSQDAINRLVQMSSGGRGGPGGRGGRGGPGGGGPPGQ